jgi:hypothetical protein
MSRLHSFIHRVQAQLACLDAAAEMIRDMPGIVLELGLGNGRTYDHLREILPGREIFVFDREIASHPDCRPGADHAFLGDFRETLPRAARQLGRRVALVHGDIGSGNKDATSALAEAIAPLLPPFLMPGALVVSDQRLEVPGARPMKLPADLPEGRYFMMRYGP